MDASPTVFETHEKGHGRTEHRYFRVAQVPAALARQLKFPQVTQVIAVDRERGDLADRMTSDETSYYVTDLAVGQVGPKQLARHIRNHWGVENRGHWMRDVTWDEDRSTARTGSGP